MACGLNTVAACITRHRQFTGVQCPCMFVAIILLFPSRWVCTGTFSYSDRSGLIHPYNQLLPVLHCGSVHLLSTLLFVADQSPFQIRAIFHPQHIPFHQTALFPISQQNGPGQRSSTSQRRETAQLSNLTSQPINSSVRMFFLVPVFLLASRPCAGFVTGGTHTPRTHSRTHTACSPGTGGFRQTEGW